MPDVVLDHPGRTLMRSEFIKAMRDQIFRAFAGFHHVRDLADTRGRQLGNNDIVDHGSRCLIAKPDAGRVFQREKPIG